MKKIIVGLFLSVGLVFGGCTNNPFVVHKDTAEVIKQNPQKGVQQLIDDAYAAITAAAHTVGSYYDSGAFTKAEALKYQGYLEQAVSYVNEADYFNGLGDVSKAQGQLDLANSLLNLVQAELIKMKQEGK